MTVYTGNPFGGFGGFGGGMRNPRMPTPRPRPMPRPMNRPPMNQYQMPPMNQMPRRMPGGPSKGGTTSIPVRPSGGGAPWGGYNPNAGFPGGPGKARNRGQSRGGSWFGGGMPGGPGKGRQTKQPQPFFGNTTAPQPDQTMGRPMPQPVFNQMLNVPPTAPPATGQMRMDRGAMHLAPHLSGLNRGSLNQQQAPSGGGFFLGNMLNNAMSQGQIGQPQPFFGGFYGGGITDLYPR